MSKSITDEEMERFWERKRIKREQEQQERNPQMKIISVRSAAYDDSFAAFEKAVEECGEDMKAITEKEWCDILILAFGSAVSSNEKVDYLLDNCISNVNLEIKNSEASMTLLGWVLMQNDDALVQKLLEKDADPNAIAYEHKETGVQLTALGVVLNDFWQYQEVQNREIEVALANHGITFTSKINETLLTLLLNFGAQLSQPAIKCADTVALIPSENKHITQLPCVKKSLLELTNIATSGNESSVLNSGSSINNTNVLSVPASGEEAKQQVPEVESAVGSIEEPVPVYPSFLTSKLLIQEEGALDSMEQKFGEFWQNVSGTYAESNDMAGGSGVGELGSSPVEGQLLLKDS